MKKLLLLAVALLSGCARDITVYRHYDIVEPVSKARLYIAEPDNIDRSQYGNVLNAPVVQQAWQKFFIKSGRESANFILTQTERDNTPDDWDGGGVLLSVLSLGVIPSWESYETTYKHSLTQTQNNKTVFLTDIKEKTRYYVGWLLLPAVFSSKTRVIANRNRLSPWTPDVLANAIKEAASLVYDRNSRLYRQLRRWTPPAAVEQIPAGNTAPASAAMPAPVKETNPEDMDLLW